MSAFFERAECIRKASLKFDSGSMCWAGSIDPLRSLGAIHRAVHSLCDRKVGVPVASIGDSTGPLALDV